MKILRLEREEYLYLLLLLEQHQHDLRGDNDSHTRGMNASLLLKMKEATPDAKPLEFRMSEGDRKEFEAMSREIDADEEDNADRQPDQTDPDVDYSLWVCHFCGEEKVGRRADLEGCTRPGEDHFRQHDWRNK